MIKLNYNIFLTNRIYWEKRNYIFQKNRIHHKKLIPAYKAKKN